MTGPHLSALMVLFSACASVRPLAEDSAGLSASIVRVKAQLCASNPDRCKELDTQNYEIAECSESCVLVQFEGRDRDGIIVYLHDGAGALACTDGRVTSSWRKSEITCAGRKNPSGRVRETRRSVEPPMVKQTVIRNDAGVPVCLRFEFPDGGSLDTTGCGDEREEPSSLEGPCAADAGALLALVAKAADCVNDDECVSYPAYAAGSPSACYAVNRNTFDLNAFSREHRALVLLCGIEDVMDPKCSRTQCRQGRCQFAER